MTLYVMQLPLKTKAQLALDAALFEPDGTLQHDLEQILEDAHPDITRDIVLAMNDGQSIGVGVRTGDLLNVYVQLHYRRRKIGRMLVELLRARASAECTDESAPSLTACTGPDVDASTAFWNAMRVPLLFTTPTDVTPR